MITAGSNGWLHWFERSTMDWSSGTNAVCMPRIRKEGSMTTGIRPGGPAGPEAGLGGCAGGALGAVDCCGTIRSTA